MCGIGEMRVDKYRLRKGEFDHAKVCYMDCMPFPHLVTTKECKQHWDYLIERNMKPRSKHCPIPLYDNECDDF